MKIKTEMINEIDGLELLFDRLNSLSQKEVIPSLCTSKPWIINWLNHYLNDADKLFVCVQQTDDRLIAIYPLYLKKISFGFELRFIGSGEPEQSEVCSEFQDFIINPAYLQKSLELFSKQLKQLKHCYRICFNNILAESYCYRWLKSYQPNGWQYRERCIGKRYLLPVASDALSQINQLPQSTLRRHARRFIERTDITVEYCQQQQELPQFFEDLIELHTAHWERRNKLGAFSSEQFRRFHHDFASNMLKLHKLLLFKLRHNNTTIGVFYGFYQNNVLYFYQSGINQISPLLNTGIALHIIALQHARNRQVKFYDLMKGAEDSYKKNYINTTCSVYSTVSNIFWLNLFSQLKKLTSIRGYFC